MWKKAYCYLFELLCEFSEISKKTLYVVAVKGSNKALLCGVQESRLFGVLALGSSSRGSWRSLY